jgi:hypothetical protein
MRRVGPGAGVLLGLIQALLLIGLASCTRPPGGAAPQSPARPYIADGRMPLEQLFARYDTLSTDHGWQRETIYRYAENSLIISAWRTPNGGPALWLLAGIHGEEPAGPNAIAASLPAIVAIADSGVPVVLIPMCNPRAYRNNWRYPNTPDRDWRGGGYSVGDSEYLLPDLEIDSRPRATQPPGPETAALTSYALRTTDAYPPLLVLDLHEDELSTDGGYVYIQSERAAHPVATEIVRLMQSADMPLRMSGVTRFGEPILNGIITGDAQGLPIRDGSIEEMLGSAEVFRDGIKVRGPGAPTLIVVETPAFAGSQLERRIAAHRAVLEQIRTLWSLNPASSR